MGVGWPSRERGTFLAVTSLVPSSGFFFFKKYYLVLATFQAPYK